MKPKAKPRAVNQKQYNDSKWAKRGNLGKGVLSDKVRSYSEGSQFASMDKKLRKGL